MLLILSTVLQKYTFDYSLNLLSLLGLLSLPSTYELFPGNTNDCLTYRPNFRRIKKLFDLGRVITAADKGMTTGDNIWYTRNTPAKDGYVFSMSIRGADKKLKDYVLKEDGYT